MPNLCFYSMRVQGKPEDVEYVIKTMQADYNYDTMTFSHERHLYRVFDAYVNSDETEDGIRDVIISGDCAWSVASCMTDVMLSYYNSNKDRPDHRGTTLLELSKDRNVMIEVFSEESGIGFQEHYLVRSGEEIINECVDYHEVYKEYLEEDGETIEEYVEKHGLKMEDVRDDGEDYFYVGGFKDWDFEEYNVA